MRNIEDINKENGIRKEVVVKTSHPSPEFTSFIHLLHSNTLCFFHFFLTDTIDFQTGVIHITMLSPPAFFIFLNSMRSGSVSVACGVSVCHLKVLGGGKVVCLSVVLEGVEG